MAKPDWGELQQRFLSDHAATGVSPKEWCKAQGLNYATARRYIKKPFAQIAQKSAQQKLRAAQKDKSVDELVDDDGLTTQQRRFVAEYASCFPAAERPEVWNSCVRHYLGRRPGPGYVAAHQRV